ncbi:uncharacterized protein LOC108026573 [Drosophila biarmipes]|uniref:uncharacterized protein LOC108026573 n=1 Tax=Drosophila biarmipes TaxID=125945 RepID=UPI0007E6D933|nr:uncharacterized protein LOC108026573 [Drosophila biarmipes]
MKLPFVSALYTWADKTHFPNIPTDVSVHIATQIARFGLFSCKFFKLNMSLWSQLRPMEWCRAIYRDCHSWSFVKCSLAFCAGVLLVRSLDGKLPDSSLVPEI